VSPALEALAARAAAEVAPGSTVGLGSGRAAAAFVLALARRVRAGLDVRGVPTSEATARLARAEGVPLAGLGPTPLDVAVDGADEVDPELDLIKGYGGALLRERAVALAARRVVILVGPDKLVPALGARGRLPLEVLPFAAAAASERLRRLGLAPTVRPAPDGPFVTDNGNWIIDCAVGRIADPAGLHGRLREIPGVLDTGLFVGVADAVLVADGETVRALERRSPARTGG
jgi:ribose 5-phosphate isomerase A